MSYQEIKIYKENHVSTEALKGSDSVHKPLGYVST